MMVVITVVFIIVALVFVMAVVDSTGFEIYMVKICPNCNICHDQWEYESGNKETGIICTCGLCGWTGVPLDDE